MSTTALICIICAGVLLFFILMIVLIRRSNKKRFNKLQENINKYKQENQEFDKNNKITLSKEAEEPKEQAPEESAQPKEEPVIEEYIDDRFLRKQPQREHMNRRTMPARNPNLQMQNNRNFSQKQDDFEQFLDEHAYSRRILNKDILSKIKDLPPEVKAVILSNVFNKYDD